jgi:putative transposase
MRPGRYDKLNFEESKQDFAFMLKEAERDLWGFMRDNQRQSYKKTLELLLMHEQKEQMELAGADEDISRAGFSPITLKTTLGEIAIERPRLRKQIYESMILPNYTKNEEALLELICNLYLVGVSTRKVETALRSILGKYGISAGSVSKITERIIPEIESFHKKDIEDKYIYLYLDGVSFSVIGNDNKKKRYMFLVAYGVDRHGKKEIIDYLPARSESYDSWYGFLFNLYERGLKGKYLKLIIVDGCEGLSKALEGIYQRVLRQRCWVHKLENVCKSLKKSDKEACIDQARLIYKADNLKHANKLFKQWKLSWHKLYPKAVDCLEKNLDELFTMFLFDESHRPKIRTTNPIERTFKEVRRRTKVMDNHLPNLKAAEKIFYIMCKFLNERWSTKKWLIFEDIEKIPNNLPRRKVAA